MSYQSQGPQVYQYLSREGPLTSIEGRVPLYHPTPLASFKVIRRIDDYAANPPSVSLKNFGQSRVEAVYRSHHTQQQPTAHQLRLNQDREGQVLDLENNIQSSSSNAMRGVRKQNDKETNAVGDRFQKYLDSDSSFKYNLFSAVDQPWNSCVRGQECGSLPDNECIANSNPK